MPSHAFLIAAPSSGSGKTTLTLALLRLLRDRGMEVQPFKCGPDYLDARLHSLAASSSGKARSGINLDTFMASEGHVRELFRRKTHGCDAAVIEGVMGLFDGAHKSEGSSASIARLLGLPVVMVVDAKGTAYSAAPLLHGFRTFDPELQVRGVIFNRVNSASHYAFLCDAARDAGVEPLGYVPRNESMVLSERYLGLDTSKNAGQEKAVQAMAAHVAATVDIDRLLEISRLEPAAPVAGREQPVASGQKVIAVARDEAFSFLYEENLEALAQCGELRFFSPLADQELPDADMLYLAGGYPELHAAALSRNTAMLEAVASFCRNGGVVYAECGGMMYLGAAMRSRDGEMFPMCGVLDLETSMAEPRLHLGYRKVRLHNPAFPHELRGHEFHYSCITRQGTIDNVAMVTTARDKQVDTAIFRWQNVFASYIHLYWGERREFPQFLLEEAGVAG